MTYTKKNINKTTTNRTRLFSDINKNKFNDLLEHIDFQHIMEIMSPDEIFNDFFKLYKTAFNSSLPFRELRSNNTIKREPWFTKGLLIYAKEMENYLSKNLRNQLKVI